MSLQEFFSDESTISILNDRVQTVRRRKGEEFDPQCLKKTVKFPQKIMVWGRGLQTTARGPYTAREVILSGPPVDFQ